MTKDQSSASAAGGGRKKSEFDWDSPPGKALAELFKNLTTIRAMRRAVNGVEASCYDLGPRTELRPRGPSNQGS